jgi:hypothetical protein
MIERIAISGMGLPGTSVRMKRFLLFCLLFTIFSFQDHPLIAQNAWRVIPMESPRDHQPMPFLRAIGIPATATFRGKEHKAWVFIFGPKKGPGVFHPFIEIYIEGLRQFVPEKELELFEGPSESVAQHEFCAMTVRIRRAKQEFRAANEINLHDGNYPVSIVPDEDNNNIFGSEVLTKGPEHDAWVQLMREMSAGFDEGHISFGGTAPSTKIEVDFSGNGIEPLLKDVIRYVGP